MSISALVVLQEWSSFKIDALGLVTMLGAEQIDLVVGQLTWSTFTEWLPMLGAYMIANNHITEPLPGFALYNITDGILATDLAGWFVRWLVCQDFTFCSTTVHITTPATRTMQTQRRLWRHMCSYALAILTVAPVLLGILIGDGWGITNGTTIVISILIHQVVLGYNRLALDRAVRGSEKTSCADVKVFITLPNGRVITVYTTCGIVIDCLVTNPTPSNPWLYHAARAVGWAAFGVHIISLGMARLFCQVLTVVLLVCPTLLAARQIGMDRERIGRCMKIKRVDDAQVRFRAAAYAKLDLAPVEEDSMVQWSLFPHRSNKKWWDKYWEAKQRKDFSSWDILLGKSA